MFKRRKELLKRVWKFWRGVQTSESHLENNEGEFQDKESQAVLYSLLKRLSDSNLKLLVESLESCGKKESACILLPSEEVRLGRRSVRSYKFLCKVFRWSDLGNSETVKSLWCCKSRDENANLCCCNPYHYGRIVAEDCILPPYRVSDPLDCAGKIHQGEQKDRPSESSSLDFEKSSWPADLREATSEQWPHPSSMPTEVWCQVAYWELVTRVGRLHEVYDNPLCIYSDGPPSENGLNLSVLQNSNRTKLTERVRHHIGPGFVVTKEPDGIWLYNRGEHTIFASSATLQLPGLHNGVPNIKRVPCGSSLLLFDFSRLAEVRLCSQRLNNSRDGASDLLSLRVSFAKGWGVDFSRRYITSCPCWLEIHLNDSALPSS